MIMNRSLIFCCLVFLLYCFPQSSQTPQSSFFGWSSSETVVPKTEFQTPSTTSFRPNMEETHSFPLSGSREPPALLVPPKPDILNSSQTINNSTVNLSNTTGSLPQTQNETSGLTNYLGDEISYFMTTSVVFLGAVLGRDGCDLKAACLAGTLVPPMQGRDIAMVAAEPLVPDGWKLFYQAAKASMIQGQNCSQFTCL